MRRATRRGELGDGADGLLACGADRHAPAGIKDAREWKRSGATAADVLAAIDAAPVRKLRVSVCRKAGHHAKRS